MEKGISQNGIEALKKSYGFGLGAGGSTANQEQLGPVAGRFTSMHNFWLEILVEGGVLFAFIMLLWYSGTIKLLKFLAQRQIQKLIFYSKALFLGMISFIPSAVAASSTIVFFTDVDNVGLSISIINLYERSDYVANQKTRSNSNYTNTLRISLNVLEKIIIGKRN